MLTVINCVSVTLELTSLKQSLFQNYTEEQIFVGGYKLINKAQIFLISLVIHLPGME